MAASPTITVDRARCIGSGMCVVYAPATFAHDDLAKAVVVDSSGDDPDALQAALEACPTGALRLVTGTTTPSDFEQQRTPRDHLGSKFGGDEGA